MRSLKLIPIFFFFFLVYGCASTSVKQESTFKIFNVDYPSIFVISQKVLSDYKFRVLSLKDKVIETDTYKTGQVWTPHHRKLKPEDYNTFYYLKLEFIDLGGKKSSVKITKVQTRKEPFSEPKNVNSDLVEEKLILYRIKRELLLDKVRQKFKNSSF